MPIGVVLTAMSSTSSRFARLVAAAGTLAFLGGCVASPDSVASPTAIGDTDPLASSFDLLAAQSASSGDVTRAEGFTYAAISARLGVTPSLLNVRNGTVNEVYDAFVHTVDWNLVTGSPRIPSHRTITAWRRGTDGITRILSLTTPSDSAPVLHPLSLSPGGPVAAPFAGAGGLYQETTRTLLANAPTAPLTDEFWIATAGYVRIKETTAGAACPQRSFSGVACRQARFVVRFDVSMQRLAARPYAVVANSAARRFGWTADQTINGVKLSFACGTVTSQKGCP